MNPKDFKAALVEILVSQFCRTHDEVEQLLKQFPHVIVNAVMSVDNAGQLGRMVRPCAIALELCELKERRGDGAVGDDL